MGQQVKAIAQIAPEIRSLGQQDPRFRGGLFEQPAVFIGVVRAVGACLLYTSRNSINIGLPIMECPEAVDAINAVSYTHLLLSCGNSSFGS